MTHTIYDEFRTATINPKTLPPTLLEWQVSRLDLFLNHIIQPNTANEYTTAYNKIRLYRYNNTSYDTTNYIQTKTRKSCIRIYDKLKEVYEKSTPREIVDDFNTCSTSECPADILRIEFMMRRNKLRYEFNNKKVNFIDILNITWQKKVINKYINRLHLDKQILYKDKFKDYVKISDRRASTKSDILNIARLVRTKRDPLFALKSSNNKNIKQNLYRRISSVYKDGVHIVTSNNKDINLVPVKFI